MKHVYFAFPAFLEGYIWKEYSPRGSVVLGSPCRSFGCQDGFWLALKLRVFGSFSSTLMREVRVDRHVTM